MDISLQPWLKKITLLVPRLILVRAVVWILEMRRWPRILYFPWISLLLTLLTMSVINTSLLYHLTYLCDYLFSSSKKVSLHYGYYHSFRVSNRKTSWITFAQTDSTVPLSQVLISLSIFSTQSHCNLYCDDLHHHWRLEASWEERPVSPSLGSHLYVKQNHTILCLSIQQMNEWTNEWTVGFIIYLYIA